MKTLVKNFTIGAALLMPAALFAQTAYTEGLINIPGVLPQAYGIDSSNQIVGYYYDSQGAAHGFVLSQGVVAQIDMPGSGFTTAYGINSVAGIVGYYSSTASTFAGMLDAKRSFKTPRGTAEKVVTGINSAGTFVGYGTGGKGFINVGGVYTAVQPAICTTLAAPVTVFVNGVNANGDYVGYCKGNLGASAGFAHIGGVDQNIAVFGLPTFPTGINDSGTIAGYFNDASGFEHGFILSAGTPTQFDFGGNTATAILGINNRGSLTGVTMGSSSPQLTGFYAFAN